MKSSKPTQTASAQSNTTSRLNPPTQEQDSQTTHTTNSAGQKTTSNEDKKESNDTYANVMQSYYADKDLTWWLELAGDFKSARQVPLPCEEEGDL
ncbi:hypothetical protein ONS95_009498 [Cadophora gregata]|uniref:uncharacterized protein n=1 Tax=Cadophora gregata TaxID=51156 RepID=UPI0026DD60E2|nr:uncharacterized protein ONS95_009498 [Cadophora gregata]KAK0124550.1 hypothetical protein ONS95_009498 [Cadophora gregata]KAK0129597.1 hypothetical protein ONS96_000163 [Cadophora gregata f. sp. sojae]